jgi:hypothetical protein
MHGPGVLLFAAAVTGEPSFGSSGQLVLSLPRLLPVVALDVRTVHAAGPVDATTGTSVALGNHPSGLDVYDLPRVGLDTLVTGRVTLGVEVAGYATLGATPSAGAPYVTLLGAAPRVGYLAPLASVVSAWLRAGASLYFYGEKAIDWSSGWRQLDADLEALLVFTGFPHVAVTAGAVAELPLAGRFDETRSGGGPAVDAGASWLHVGLVGGLLTYF